MKTKVAHSPQCRVLKIQFFLENDKKHMKTECERDYFIPILRKKKKNLKMRKWYLLTADLLKACFLWIQCVQQMVESHALPSINMPLSAFHVRKGFDYQATFV